MDLSNDLVLIALVAVFAQTVNGSMGMGYGAITSSLLLSMGMPPVTMSAAVHVAQIGTTSASTVSHWRLGNIDWWLTLALAIPGAAGGFAGAMLLTSLPTSAARPVVAGILFFLGVLILLRFTTGRRSLLIVKRRRRHLWPLGGTAAFFDATGGGGWGPISMGTLMAHPPAAPRLVVGSVNASEAAVTVAASIGFIAALGFGGVPWAEVGALMAGGVLAALPAAWLARHIPAQGLGLAVATLLLVLNTRLLATWIGVSIPVVLAAMVVVGLACVAFMVATRHRRPAWSQVAGEAQEQRETTAA